MKKIISIIIISVLIIVGGYSIWRWDNIKKSYNVPALTEATLKSIDLSSADKLMIVAHPDDETLWGGGHLLEKGWLVVCITNGRNSVRSAEFKSVMNESGNKGIILSYPDKVLGKRDDWSKVKGKITTDLKLVMTYKPWKQIATHNADGEYGHAHHKMTHSIVKEIYDSCKMTGPLFVFGKYYKASDLPDVSSQLIHMDESMISRKEHLLTLYTSQGNTTDSLSHMNPYEEWEQIISRK